MTFRDKSTKIIIGLNTVILSVAAIASLILFNRKSYEDEENPFLALLVDHIVNILYFNGIFGILLVFLTYFIKLLRFKMMEYSYLNNQTKKEFQFILQQLDQAIITRNSKYNI